MVNVAGTENISLQKTNKALKGDILKPTLANGVIGKWPLFFLFD
jgi:hypothetical protein